MKLKDFKFEVLFIKLSEYISLEYMKRTLIKSIIVELLEGICSKKYEGVYEFHRKTKLCDNAI